jgi:hypothetical protein
MASTFAVRIFELGCLVLWLAGLRWVLRTRNPVFLGAYTASALLVLFDWTFNAKWFFRVDYSSHFIPLWIIEGARQPVALAMNYAFYFGAPVALLVHNRDRIDRRFGTRGWLVVFVVSSAALPVFEIPMVKVLHLWHYYQRPGFLLGGVPWSNIWYSGMLTTACYGAVRLALRWSRVPSLVGGPALREATVDREEWWRGFVMGLGAIWAAFYLAMLVQLVWYALTQPWVPTPRPF